MSEIKPLALLLPNKDQLLYNIPLKKYTTFRVGGPADILALPQNIDQVSSLIQYAQHHNIPFLVIGAGSNLLVSDQGFPGIVIRLAANFNHYEINDHYVETESGLYLSALAKTAATSGLSGLEFAEGIPGTIGGGVTMNAGAFGGELSQVVQTVTVLNSETNEIKNLISSELQFGYRQSLMQKQPYIILRTKFKLIPEDPEVIRKTMQQFALKRKEKQPLNLPSAGSTFKRPEGHFVGTMIETLNLKGFRIGDAAISEKHAGFIVNLGNATAQDIYRLIHYIIDKVYVNFNIILEPEVKFIGSFE